MERRNLNLPVVLMTLLLLTSTAASANSITALMLAVWVHMFVGNLFIGVIESSLLARIYRVRLGAWGWLAILSGNYLSAWACTVLLSSLGGGELLTSRMTEPLYQMPVLLPFLVLAAFALTVALEWGFFRIALWIGKHKAHTSWLTSLKATLIVNAISYALLLPLFYSVSSRGIYRDLSRDPSLAFVQNKSATVYYLDHSGNVCRMRADGSGKKMIRKAQFDYEGARLTIHKSKDGRSWELCEAQTSLPMPIRVAGDVQMLPSADRKSQEALSKGKWSSWDPLDLRPKKDRDWVEIYGSETETLYRQRSTGQRVSIHYETPFAYWCASSLTVLPGDEIVCDLEGQIVIVNLRSRKIGLLAIGRGPVVIPDYIRS